MVPICLYCFNCTKFSQLILRKIIEIVATICQILSLKCTKFNFGWGSAPYPAGGAYSAPPDLLPGFKGPTSKGREEREGKGGGGEGVGREREEEGRGGKGRKKGRDVEGPGKWSAPGPALVLGGPAPRYLTPNQKNRHSKMSRRNIRRHKTQYYSVCRTTT